MALNDVLPSYVEPCLIDRSDSDWLSAFDFGEYYYPPPDSYEYPQLTLVYNGKVLHVQSELIHASLSGISIKHYYGKCCQEQPEEEGTEAEQDEENWEMGYGEGDMDDTHWLSDDAIEQKEDKLKNSAIKEDSATEDGSFEYREDSVPKEGQPICTLPRINCRNSFWNIHRPELCKLTWGQKYVSAAVVIDHLHEHLTAHGELCEGFHTEEERKFMLNKELDEYVRLKVLACPRILPPDEPLINFNEEKEAKYNKRCKARGIPQRKFTTPRQNRYFQIKDDEEIEGKSIHRSKEEFCLTIGKYVSQPLFIPSVPVFEKPYITPELSSAGEEEVSGFFNYNWFLYGEESYAEHSGGTRSMSFSETESDSTSEPKSQPCPPLMLDDFCRAVGKADFSDLRCNPDF